MLVTRFPSCDLFRLLAPARTAVPYFLFPFAFLRLTVGRVSELLYAYCRTGCPMPRSDQDAVAAFPLHLVRMYPHTGRGDRFRLQRPFAFRPSRAI